MDPEDKGDSPGDFGKIIDTLHKKQKLPSLRTYQGDMAQFIKEKNESVLTIAVKEKERKQKIEEEEKKLEPVVKTEKLGGNFKKNIIIISASLVLVVSGIIISYFAFSALKEEPAAPITIEKEIIPYNNTINLTNVMSGSLGKEISKLNPPSGISILKISGMNGTPIKKSKDFFDFIGISLPPTLERALKDDYAVGVISQNGQISRFIVISISDFGLTFSGMLDWESNMERDLVFLSTNLPAEESSPAAAAPLSTTTAAMASTSSATTTSASSTAAASSTPPVSVEIPFKIDYDSYNWRDLIVKNKDTRALANEKHQAKIAYTFLDKNTILITNNLSAIGDISSIYASRSIVR